MNTNDTPDRPAPPEPPTARPIEFKLHAWASALGVCGVDDRDCRLATDLAQAAGELARLRGIVAAVEAKAAEYDGDERGFSGNSVAADLRRILEGRP